MYIFYDITHFLTTSQFQLKLNQSFMKEAHLFNKWYFNKYEQEYVTVLFIGVEIFNITVYFSRKHNFWTYQNKLSQVQYSKYFFQC